MKILFTVLLFIVLHSLTYSQSVLKKDSYNIGGGVSFSITDNNYPTYNSKIKLILFNPSIKYHVLKVLSIGGEMHFHYSNEKIETDSSNLKLIKRIFCIGPNVRYYFHDKNFAPFVESSILYSILLPETISGYRISVGIGISYFITKNAAVEPHVSYIYNNFTNSDYNIRTFLLGIGIKYYFNN
jgi:long-subunit fatty acid transport protein